MAVTTGLGVGMCPCTHPRSYILLALNLPSLPFPGGCAGVARRRPPGREKAEEAMVTIPLRAPGRSRAELEEATRISHHILATILTTGILPDLGHLTQVLIL